MRCAHTAADYLATAVGGVRLKEGQWSREEGWLVRGGGGGYCLCIVCSPCITALPFRPA